MLAVVENKVLCLRLRLRVPYHCLLQDVPSLYRFEIWSLIDDYAYLYMNVQSLRNSHYEPEDIRPAFRMFRSTKAYS